MKSSTRKWLYGLGSASIGGGCAAVISGVTSMGIDPEKFNMTDTKGFLHLLAMVGINFTLSGILSAVFYLKQSPLPPESFDTTTITKPE